MEKCYNPNPCPVKTMSGLCDPFHGDRKDCSYRRPVVDELTERMIAIQDDMKAHPENWQITMKCRICGTTWSYPMNNLEVIKWKENHGTEPFLTTCKKCAGTEDEDDV